MKKSRIGVDACVLDSVFLARTVRFDACYPLNIPGNPAKLLLLNDGQDAGQLKLIPTLEKLIAAGSISPVIVVAVHANENRMQEYGIAHQVDYRGRGKFAGHYSKFITQELIPALQKKYSFTGKHSFAGFSLGGLSALDITWNHPLLFERAGIFSGSLWWRNKSYNEGYTDKNRIAHEMIRLSNRKPVLKAWFQCGTLDEKEDRNKNGIIDSLDDTRDLVQLLEAKGYTDHDLKYVEVKNGRHDFRTWSKVFPRFMEWAYGK